MDRAARQAQLFQEIDQLYEELETSGREFPCIDYVMAVERELFHELAQVTYEMYRETRTV